MRGTLCWRWSRGKKNIEKSSEIKYKNIAATYSSNCAYQHFKFLFSSINNEANSVWATQFYVAHVNVVKIWRVSVLNVVVWGWGAIHGWVNCNYEPSETQQLLTIPATRSRCYSSVNPRTSPCPPPTLNIVQIYWCFLNYHCLMSRIIS